MPIFPLIQESDLERFGRLSPLSFVLTVLILKDFRGKPANLASIRVQVVAHRS